MGKVKVTIRPKVIFYVKVFLIKIMYFFSKDKGQKMLDGLDNKILDYFKITI